MTKSDAMQTGVALAAMIFVRIINASDCDESVKAAILKKADDELCSLLVRIQEESRDVSKAQPALN